jgi:hypothetical protein
LNNEEAEAASAEARKTKETAERLANGEYPEDADHIRVLAGMIHQLAEQVERLASQDAGPTDGPEQVGTQPSSATDERLEEDVTPERAPAQPADDRSTS